MTDNFIKEILKLFVSWLVKNQDVKIKGSHNQLVDNFLKEIKLKIKE